jgi:hypothetical protein
VLGGAPAADQVRNGSVAGRSLKRDDVDRPDRAAPERAELNRAVIASARAGSRV